MVVHFISRVCDRRPVSSASWTDTGSFAGTRAVRQPPPAECLAWARTDRSRSPYGLRSCNRLKGAAGSEVPPLLLVSLLCQEIDGCGGGGLAGGGGGGGGPTGGGGGGVGG